MEPNNPGGERPNSGENRNDAAPGEPRVLRSETLMGGHRQVVILHNNEQYVLRVTRQGKLILNK